MDEGINHFLLYKATEKVEAAKKKNFKDMVLCKQLPNYESPLTEIFMEPLVSEATIDLRKKTDSDSEKAEYLYRFTRGRDGKSVEVRPSIGQPIRGEKNRVNAIRPHGAGRFSKRRLEYLGTAHSHEDVSPANYADLGVLLGDEDLFNIVVGKCRSYLFRLCGKPWPIRPRMDSCFDCLVNSASSVGGQVGGFQLSLRIAGLIKLSRFHGLLGRGASILKTGESEAVENGRQWLEEQEKDFKKRIRQGKQRAGESVEEMVDRVIWEQTKELCKKHRVLIYESDDFSNYSLFRDDK